MLRFPRVGCDHEALYDEHATGPVAPSDCIILKYVLFSFSPVALFLFAGIGLFLFGASFGCWVFYAAVTGRVPSAATVMAAAPLLTGIHFLVNSMMLDIQESPDWNPRLRPRHVNAARGNFGRQSSGAAVTVGDEFPEKLLRVPAQR